ncbi:hypothetical protein [Chryseobacterium lathyri]|uniref:hypothetical protein n=1 Tax=Chryseobacterium lathyri TaxID=395933 RepID=UPI00278A03E5|nr:hypothetical protein [Chryseobacterium lathyri]MDQ0068225.1 hypothetical protein [Chryseobacterium lathyri]
MPQNLRPEYQLEREDGWLGMGIVLSLSWEISFSLAGKLLDGTEKGTAKTMVESSRMGSPTDFSDLAGLCFIG